MANILTTNPIHISAVQTSYKAAVAASLGTLFTLMVHHFRWIDVGTIGDEVQIIDPQSGQELLHLKASAASSEITGDWSAKPRLWRDFAVIKFDSGQLDIFLV